MENKKAVTREEAKLGITSRVEADRGIAQNTPENLIPNIPGAYFIIQWDKGKPNYWLKKTYYLAGHYIIRKLRYYGVRPPRGAKSKSRRG